MPNDRFWNGYNVRHINDEFNVVTISNNNNNNRYGNIRNEPQRQWVVYHNYSVNEAKNNRGVGIDALTWKKFAPNSRAVKFKSGTSNKFVSISSLRRLTKTSASNVYKMHGNTILFSDPWTRRPVRRSDLTFIQFTK